MHYRFAPDELEAVGIESYTVASVLLGPSIHERSTSSSVIIKTLIQ